MFSKKKLRNNLIYGDVDPLTVSNNYFQYTEKLILSYKD